MQYRGDTKRVTAPLEGWLTTSISDEGEQGIWTGRMTMASFIGFQKQPRC